MSQTLSDLAHQGSDLMHKENAALWKIKHLQTRLNGDHTWAPAELMVGANDLELFENDYMSNTRSDQGSVAAERKLLMESTQSEANESIDQRRTSAENGDVHDSRNADNSRTTDGHTPEPNPLESISNGDNATLDKTVTTKADGTSHGQLSLEENDPSPVGHSKLKEASRKQDLPHDGLARDLAPNGSASNDVRAAAEDAIDKPVAGNVDGSQRATAAMSTTSDVPRDLYIHPLFLAPTSARPDRDLGLPETEAEEVRRLLQAFVQKQEEVCRGSKRLYEGLLRADRLRKTVYQWSKYEAHTGPNRDMSDGEDWYDKEEWGLEEDLKKGQDEEEEDTTQPAKKTRARRQ
jgi:hypothetical protein